ncbi:MAG: DUF4145 domain-containing protein [Anaerolineaceae bacterium]
MFFNKIIGVFEWVIMNDKKSASKLSLKTFHFCNKCKSETNHICISEHKTYLPFEEYWEENWYRIWICAGCETPVFEISSTMMGMVDRKGEQVYGTIYYPPRLVNYIAPKKYRKLSAKLETIYNETIKAYNNEMYVLCAVGLRSLLEGICNDKDIKGENLEQKIEGLVNFLPKNIVENLHAFRFIGNKAVHELDYPEKYNLQMAIEICDDLLNYLYELDYKIKRFANVGKENQIPTYPKRKINDKNY